MYSSKILFSPKRNLINTMITYLLLRGKNLGKYRNRRKSHWEKERLIGNKTTLSYFQWIIQTHTHTHTRARVVTNETPASNRCVFCSHAGPHAGGTFTALHLLPFSGWIPHAGNICQCMRLAEQNRLLRRRRGGNTGSSKQRGAHGPKNKTGALNTETTGEGK